MNVYTCVWHQDVPEYVEEWYLYLRELEKKHAPPANYMTGQTDINAVMREILIDWLVTVPNDIATLGGTAVRVSIENTYLVYHR